jgi:SAM-dependent methyltransferase
MEVNRGTGGHAEQPILSRLKRRLGRFVRRQAARRLSKVRGRWHLLITRFGPRVPQADVLERNLQAFAVRDWRRHFASRLHGRGLEIGALHRPLEKHPGMQVEYVDIHSAAELRAIYPELSDADLVDADIIDDAQTLSRVPSGGYDFVVAPHVVEHMRNPILALESWLRVLKPGGLLYLVVPDKRANFDGPRVRTSLAHLVLDYLRPSKERDYEHYLDYSVHVQKARWAGMIAEADRLEALGYNIHFHVFMPSDVVDLLRWMDLNVRRLEIVEGPSMSPGSDEFHLLVRVPADAELSPARQGATGSRPGEQSTGDRRRG